MNPVSPLNLRAKIRAGQFVVGTFVEIAAASVVEILGLAGFDFVIIDREHGSIDLLQAEELIRAAQHIGVAPIVRVAKNDPVLIRQPLDMGASGLHIPQIGTAAGAQEAARSATFAPLGDRGLQPFVRAAQYGALPPAEFMQRANDETLVVIHIEGGDGLANLSEILTVERVDVIFIGPYDLSQSLGLPGQTRHPEVEKRVREIAERAQSAGKAVGMFCETPADVDRWRKAGVTYAALSIDAKLLLNACRDVIAQVRADASH